MRIAITGATGNVGSALAAALARDDAVEEIVGIARRRPPALGGLARFVEADVADGDLNAAFAGTDALVHLAWEIQPSRDRERLRRTNIVGTRRVLAAAVAAGVRRVVVASSIGVYARGPKDRLVDESWSRVGIASSTYSVHKAIVERDLDALEERHPDLRVVRLRPALIFQRASATEQRRLFAGPFVPGRLLRHGRLLVLPDVAGLCFQAVHAADAAEAYRLAVLSDSARGAYNVAAEPVLDMPGLARLLDARSVRVPRWLARRAFGAAYALRLHPSEPSWLDLALQTPLISSDRIARELGWEPRISADATMAEVLSGVADGAGDASPPLAPDAIGGRLAEVRGGVGSRVPGIDD